MDKRNGFLSFLTEKKRLGWLIAALAVILIIGLAVLLDNTSGKQDSTTEDIAELCSSVEGVGKCIVMVTYSSDGVSVSSVAVICEGGDSVAVRLRLTELLSSLYGIGAHRICVEKME